MNVEAELRKDGIEIIGRLDTSSVNSISRNVAEKICKAFLKGSACGNGCLHDRYRCFCPGSRIR